LYILRWYSSASCLLRVRDRSLGNRAGDLAWVLVLLEAATHAFDELDGVRRHDVRSLYARSIASCGGVKHGGARFMDPRASELTFFWRGPRIRDAAASHRARHRGGEG